MRLRTSLKPGTAILFIAFATLLAASCDEPTYHIYPECTTPAPFLIGGQETGYETCTGGPFHRREVMDCPDTRPRAGQCDSIPAGSGACTFDSDCTDKPYGTCTTTVPVTKCACTYGCTKDSECKEHSICLCANPVGTCVKATCTSDLDCFSGSSCTEYTIFPGCPAVAFTCQTPRDLCKTRNDCNPFELCSFTGAKLDCVRMKDCPQPL